jgi:hypothetical protein
MLRAQLDLRETMEVVPPGFAAVSPTFTQCLSRGIKRLIIGLYAQYEGGTK